MEEAFSLRSNIMRENSLEYYQNLRERVENSPLSFVANPFFPELSKKEEEDEKAPAD